MYVLNLAEDNRILSAWVMLENQNYNNMPIVDTLPTDSNITDYKYINNEYVYDPLPVEEIVEEPSQLDIIEAQVTYTAMMTDTLLEV